MKSIIDSDAIDINYKGVMLLIGDFGGIFHENCDF